MKWFVSGRTLNGLHSLNKLFSGTVKQANYFYSAPFFSLSSFIYFTFVDAKRLTLWIICGVLTRYNKVLVAKKCSFSLNVTSSLDVIYIMCCCCCCWWYEPFGEVPFTQVLTRTHFMHPILATAKHLYVAHTSECSPTIFKVKKHAKIDPHGTKSNNRICVFVYRKLCSLKCVRRGFHIEHNFSS